jgi:hypothetical protein
MSDPNLDPSNIYGFLLDHQQIQKAWGQQITAGDSPASPKGHNRLRNQSPSSTLSRQTRQSSVWSAVSFAHSSVPSRRSELSRGPELPPDVADMIVSQTERGAYSILPCEFAWMGYGGKCNAIFHPHETDLWIDHIISYHLRDKLPSKALCWFCDDYMFDARVATKGDRRANFDNRMAHISQHIDEGKTVHQIRPDFYFLEHLKKHKLISQDVADEVTKCEGPEHTMDGIYRYDFIPEEQLQQMEMRSRIIVNQGKEDRERRRRNHHCQHITGHKRSEMGGDPDPGYALAPNYNPKMTSQPLNRKINRRESEAASNSDHGYAPALNCDISPNFQARARVSTELQLIEPIVQPDIKHSEDDARTTHLEDTTTMSDIIEICINNICTDIHVKIGRHIDTDNWSLMAECLPWLIKGFAIEIDLDYSKDMIRRVMNFIHDHYQ